jgi:glyoxylase-like metal-dependent hydrolase (beta-lactamase superfamily II)
MIFEQIKIGGDRNFAYLVGNGKSKLAAVVDPAFHPEKLLELAEKHGLKIKYAVNTHAHYDHSNGNSYIIKRTGARLVGYGLREPAISVRDGDELPLGELTIKVIYTPGHTTDSICILVDNKLMSGDTLFVGKVGGTGYGQDARQEYDSLHNKLLVLPNNVEVWPGHDYGIAPMSTIGNEKKTNPFILRDSFESFLELKKNWLEYKRIHGIE